MNKQKHPFLYSGIFSLVLVGAMTFCLCDTFVFEQAYGRLDDSDSVSQSITESNSSVSESSSISENPSTSNNSSISENSSSEESISESVSTSTEDPLWPTVPVLTSRSYISSTIRINIETVKIPSTSSSGTTTTYIADVELKSLSSMLGTFAVNSSGYYGKNITQTTSEMLEDHGGMLGINGDYCWYRNYGIVVRNGKSYRNTSRSESKVEDLVIYNDGTFATVNEKTSNATSLINSGARDVYSFGPGLVKNGAISVTTDEEVLSQSKSSNPRTAIGMIAPLHYLFVVSDGRTSISEGLSLYELATVLKSKGVIEGYNLDGGGSSTMVFNGEVINQPTNDGYSIEERSVSDLIYVKP